MSGIIKSLFGSPEAAITDGRILTREDCNALFERILDVTTGGGHTSVNIESRWNGNLRWARNRVNTSGDIRDTTVHIVRSINGAEASVSTNKLDTASLRLAVETAERTLLYKREDLDAVPMPKAQQYLSPVIWSDTTYALNGSRRSKTARDLVMPAAAEKLSSAGYVQAQAVARAVINTMGMDAYYPMTRAECSVTVRNPAQRASGWAGMDHYDWDQIDATAIAARAMQKCVDSAEPRAIEPGRYTTILEPQAVHDLFYPAIGALDRVAAEMFPTVYMLEPNQSKIGEQILDSRIVVSTDPMDPDGGYIPFDDDGYPYRAVKWIDGGVLRELAYGRSYALSQLGHGIPLPNPYAYRLHGGTVTLDEMIASTERGILVTRLSNVSVTHATSLYSTGTTRDGAWLIEDGAIKYPIANLRFTDSPMFALNSIEQIGIPQRVFAEHPAIVPPIKVRDFNFSSMADAV